MLKPACSKMRAGGIRSATFRHLGALGAVSLAVLDSSPIPTFGGPDILIAILVATRPNPWYEYAAVAAIGSTIGAFLTFRLARKVAPRLSGRQIRTGKSDHAAGGFPEVGHGYAGRFHRNSVSVPDQPGFRGGGGFGLSLRQIPRAGEREPRRAIHRAIAVVAHLYGRHFVRVLRHPTQYWG